MDAVDDGLSPLARGTLERVAELPCGLAVYPRWRGEHPTAPNVLSRMAGLSPLARGTHFPRWEKVRHARFIPAGAGNTVETEITWSPVAVYPRWRGEHSKHTYLFLNKFIPHQQSTN